LGEAPRRTLFTDLFAAEATATAHDPVFMETVLSVSSHEARPICVSRPGAALEGLGKWTGL
jgi:hypothetical protein